MWHAQLSGIVVAQHGKNKSYGYELGSMAHMVPTKMPGIAYQSNSGLGTE